MTLLRGGQSLRHLAIKPLHERRPPVHRRRRRGRDFGNDLRHLTIYEKGFVFSILYKRAPQRASIKR